MSETKKDYYNIAQESSAFNSWCAANDPELRKGLQTVVQVWQARAMFAVAQQLSIIAAHLGTITKGVKQQ